MHQRLHPHNSSSSSSRSPSPSQMHSCSARKHLNHHSSSSSSSLPLMHSCSARMHLHLHSSSSSSSTPLPLSLLCYHPTCPPLPHQSHPILVIPLSPLLLSHHLTRKHSAHHSRRSCPNPWRLTHRHMWWSCLWLNLWLMLDMDQCDFPLFPLITKLVPSNVFFLCIALFCLLKPSVQPLQLSCRHFHTA